MTERARRRQLRDSAKHIHPEAGVYLIRNQQSNKALLGSSANLTSIRNKLAFAQSTNSLGVLDQRLSQDIRQWGLDAIVLEILEVLETTPEMTSSDIQKELATLEELWREQLDPGLLY